MLLVCGLLTGALAVPAEGRVQRHPSRGHHAQRDQQRAHRAPTARRRAQPDRPDIVLLVLDDLPAMDDRILERLPTIKRLFLDRGARFTDAIGNDPLCCPGRANLLTGRWAHHTGVIRNDARLFDPRVSLATALQDAGYWTGIFGKYFNRTEKLRDKTPPGWDRSFIFAHSYWNYEAWTDGRYEPHAHDADDYSTTQLQAHALSALASAPRRGPRFLWLSPFAVHIGPDGTGKQRWRPQAAPRDVGSPACMDLPPWSTPAHQEADLSDKPAFLSGRPSVASWPVRATCEALLSVDRMLEAVLDRLRDRGRGAPLVILTSDNGMTWGAHRWTSKAVPYATPIPLFISWPPRLGRQPRTIETTVSNVDVAPTVCRIAGCHLGPFPDGGGVDGMSFLPVLLDPTASLGREVVFEEHQTNDDVPALTPWRGVRTTNEAAIGRWVYTEYTTGERELYHLGRKACWEWVPGEVGDPCQLVDRAGDPAAADVEALLQQTLAGQDTVAGHLRLRRPGAGSRGRSAATSRPPAVDPAGGASGAARGR